MAACDTAEADDVMGLEAPLALLGLLLAGLPFLLHRIRRRDLIPIPLPTFRLLIDAEAKKRRSRGLTDLLLLALRVGILATACIGLAAPYVTARLNFGDGSVASVAIVIDDSMSMLRQQGPSTLLHQAVSQAREAVRSLPPGSEVAIVLGGQPPRVLVRRTDQLELVELELDRSVESGLRSSRIADAALLAVQQLGGARNANRRLLILSDFAAHTRLTPEQLRFDGVQVTVHPLAREAAATNLSFASARAMADPSARGQTSIAFELAADGEVPAPVTVVVHNGGAEIARTQVEVSVGKGRGNVIVSTPTRDQDPTATLGIEHVDGLAEDNRVGLLLRGVDAVQVMLVNGDPHPASNQDELYYAQSALRLSSLTSNSLSVRAVDADALVKYDLASVDVIVLANVPAPQPALARQLSTFVERGGGLIVAAGHHVRPAAYNASWADTLPCRIRARSDQAARLSPPTGSTLLGDGPSGLTHVESKRRLLLECEGGVELRYEDGSPALAVGQHGRGRTALLATSIDTDWGDLPLRPGFLPLLVGLVRHVSQTTSDTTTEVIAGSTVQIPIPPGADELEIVAPDGLRFPFDDLAGRDTVKFTETGSAGAYRVLAASSAAPLADAPRGAFVVGIPAGESDLRPLPDLANLTSADTDDAVGAVVQRPLSPPIFLLFVLLVLAEGLVRLRGR